MWSQGYTPGFIEAAVRPDKSKPQAAERVEAKSEILRLRTQLQQPKFALGLYQVYLAHSIKGGADYTE